MKTKTYPGIGAVAFVRSRRARKFTLSVRPGRGVRMTYPWYSAFRDAEAFIMGNTEWLKEKISLARKHEESMGVTDCPVKVTELRETLRERARDYLPGRTAELATRHGFSYRRVTIRSSRTRWGSCSAVNNINLSLYLMQLPSHLIDYVILHELVHTVHKNHGPSFWQLLDQVTGKARLLAAEVRSHRIRLQ